MSASIKSLYCEDFQSHSKTKIDLAPEGGLTILWGPTDSGKTAIVRALRLLFYNVPSGTDFIRVGRSTAIVAIELSDGTKVVRERSKSVNRYRIVKEGKSPQIFEGFGASVPLEVQEATGVRVVSIGDSLNLTLNLSEQLDGPFLGKSVSGPAKAKILGALAGTEEVDKAQRDVGLDLHRAGQEETRLAGEIKALDARITEYDYLPELAERISALEAWLASVREAQARLSVLESARGRLDALGSQRSLSLAVMVRWSGIGEAAVNAEHAELALAGMRILSERRDSLASIAASKAESGAKLSRWSGLSEAITLHAEGKRAWHGKVKLEGLRDDLALSQKHIAGHKSVLSRWAGVVEADRLISEAREAREKGAALFRLKCETDRIKADTEDALKTSSRWARLTDADTLVSETPSLASRFAALIRSREALTSIRQSRVIAEDSLSRHAKALGDARSLYADTLAAMGVCPVCGSRVSLETVKNHIQEVE